MRFSIDADLTESEINELLDAIKPYAETLCDDEVGYGSAEPSPNVSDAEETITRLCEGRRTNSGGVWDAKAWIEADGRNPPLSDGPFFPLQQGAKEVDLQHDSTDTELSELAQLLHESAACESFVTLENLDSYLLAQRNILRTRKDV